MIDKIKNIRDKKQKKRIIAYITFAGAIILLILILFILDIIYGPQMHEMMNLQRNNIGSW